MKEMNYKILKKLDAFLEGKCEGLVEIKVKDFYERVSFVNSSLKGKFVRLTQGDEDSISFPESLSHPDQEKFVELLKEEVSKAWQDIVSNFHDMSSSFDKLNVLVFKHDEADVVNHKRGRITSIFEEGRSDFSIDDYFRLIELSDYKVVVNNTQKREPVLSDFEKNVLFKNGKRLAHLDLLLSDTNYHYKSKKQGSLFVVKDIYKKFTDHHFTSSGEFYFIKAFCQSSKCIVTNEVIITYKDYLKDILSGRRLIKVDEGLIIAGHERGYILYKKYKLKVYNNGDRKIYFFEENELEQGKQLNQDQYRDMSRINSYSYSPSNLNFTKMQEEGETPLYMGAEIEMSNGGQSNENAHLFVSALTGNKPLAWNMHDGSLYNGFEVATHPSTLKAHMNKNYFNYERAFSVAKSLSYTAGSSEDCGLHIHINRDFFGEEYLSKYAWSLLLYLLERLWDDVLKFSRRAYNSLNNYARKFDSNAVLSKGSVFRNVGELNKIIDKYGYEKMVMVNARRNRKTIEFRLFKGTLNTTAYLATLQFVHNICHIVKDALRHQGIDVDLVNSITFLDIVKYKEFDELNEYWTNLSSYYNVD